MRRHAHEPRRPHHTRPSTSRTDHRVTSRRRTSLAASRRTSHQPSLGIQSSCSSLWRRSTKRRSTRSTRRAAALDSVGAHRGRSTIYTTEAELVAAENAHAFASIAAALSALPLTSHIFLAAQISLWDKIIESPEEAKFNFPFARNKYRLIDQARLLAALQHFLASSRRRAAPLFGLLVALHLPCLHGLCGVVCSLPPSRPTGAEPPGKEAQPHTSLEGDADCGEVRERVEDVPGAVRAAG